MVSTLPRIPPHMCLRPALICLPCKYLRHVSNALSKSRIECIANLPAILWTEPKVLAYVSTRVLSDLLSRLDRIPVDRAMRSPDSNPILCKVCSKLDLQRMTHSLHPCRDSSTCSTPPIGNKYDDFPPLGSIDEIKSRRSICDICKLIAESLDREPTDLDGSCVIRETAQYCNFTLPEYVKARDPNVTHFHFTQVSVIFDTSAAKQFQGPSLPWDLRARDEQSNHYILSFQVSQYHVLSRLMLNSEVKVKARSCAAAGNPTTTSPRTEQEFLDTVGGRCVTTQVDVQLIRAWLHRCENKHGVDCTPSSRLSVEKDGEPVFQPTFVIDVVQSCLADTPSQCRYVALSYVWGRAPVFMHRQKDTPDLRKSGSLRSLPIPATIRDAITLVHAIGERYLWVDSLCIIQDDLRMKQAEIVRMGSIYSRALFTIIAAAGDHANSGLSGVKQGSREQVQKTLKLNGCELLTAIDVQRTPDGINNTAWGSRAWTFQERVLSSRVLVFSEDQVYWSCRVASYSEERALEEVQDIDQHRPSFHQNTATDCLSWEPLEPSLYRDLYYDVLSNYRDRHLTYQTDILNAFSGVSEILAALQNDTFLWGLPESYFSYAVTWFFTGHSTRNHVSVPIFDDDGTKQMIPVPSWSWAAWSGEDPNRRIFLHGGFDNTYVRPVIHFDMVDAKHQLVRIKEQQGHLNDCIPTLWKNEHAQSPQARQDSVSQIGQLRFWTSYANVRAVRGQGLKGPTEVQFTPLPPPDFQPAPNAPHYRTEIVYQDFIVVAASGMETSTLILLAIEWKDGVAYRVGITNVKEEDWLRVENREWRLVILG